MEALGMKVGQSHAAIVFSRGKREKKGARRKVAG